MIGSEKATMNKCILRVTGFSFCQRQHKSTSISKLISHFSMPVLVPFFGSVTESMETSHCEVRPQHVNPKSGSLISSRLPSITALHDPEKETSTGVDTSDEPEDRLVALILAVTTTHYSEHFCYARTASISMLSWMLTVTFVNFAWHCDLFA